LAEALPVDLPDVAAFWVFAAGLSCRARACALAAAGCTTGALPLVHAPTSSGTDRLPAA